MASSKINSIGLFIDGGYYMKINEALANRKENRMRLNLHNLINYVRKCVSEHYEVAKEDCLVTESHYFQGRYRARNITNKKQFEDDRYFEDKLIEEDVVLHFKHIQDVPSDADPTKTVVREKGIDVWFALETFELSMYRDFDFVVLITGDTDHEMLARKIKALKKQVILLTWTLDDKTKSGKYLREEVTYHIDLATIVKEDNSVVISFADYI